MKRVRQERGLYSKQPQLLVVEDIHHILSNRRRRLVLEQLRNGESEMQVREIADRIAELESAKHDSPPTGDRRRSVYISLIQNHLPKLCEFDVIEYDQRAKTVTLGESFRQVNCHMNTEVDNDISWNEFYFGLYAIGVVSVYFSHIGVPMFGALPTEYWAYTFLTVGVICAATYAVTETDQLGLFSTPH